VPTGPHVEGHFKLVLLLPRCVYFFHILRFQRVCVLVCWGFSVYPAYRGHLVDLKQCLPRDLPLHVGNSVGRNSHTPRGPRAPL